MSEVATYAISSTLTIVLFIAATIGILKTASIIYNAYRMNKVRKILKVNKDAKIVAFDAKGIPTILKIKDESDKKGKLEKWLYL